ncbi:MAG TPA: hypothetical protein VJH37_05265 [Candidatus Nanoarchaeia archaeon]|nr:hypothetical protein [Candidatus Nanoarchaeia archaeon]
MKRGLHRKAEVAIPESWNAFSLILFIGLFLLLYIIILPEGEKERLIGGQPVPIYPGSSYGGNTYSPVERQILFSQSIGDLQPFGQKIYAKPLASVNLYADTDKDEEILSKSLDVTGGIFSGTEKELIFRVSQEAPVGSVKLLFFLEKAKGDITILLNGREIFSGLLTISQLPLLLPVSSLRPVNHLTFSVSSSGIFSKNSYVLRDVTLFRTYRIEHTAEQRTFVLTADDLQRFGHLSLFYIVNCFTANERGNIQINLNNKLLSQQQIVCDAGEVSHDLARNDLREGRNVLTFAIDGGKYVLERILIEGDIDAGKAPGYYFSVPVATYDSLGSVGQITMNVQMTSFDNRKVATFFINGYTLYLDTYDNTFTFDITPYVVLGQNSLRIAAGTSFDIASLDIFLE